MKLILILNKNKYVLPRNVGVEPTTSEAMVTANDVGVVTPQYKLLLNYSFIDYLNNLKSIIVKKSDKE